MYLFFAVMNVFMTVIQPYIYGSIFALLLFWISFRVQGITIMALFYLFQFNILNSKYLCNILHYNQLLKISIIISQALKLIVLGQEKRSAIMRKDEHQVGGLLIQNNQKQHFIQQQQAQEFNSIIRTSRKANFRLILSFLTIIVTSHQIYTITTDKVDHSRSFIRCLNYYILQHQDFGIYWNGQYANNYPMHEYYQLGQVQDFLDRTLGLLSDLDQYAYGQMDIEKFSTQQHKIIVQRKTGQIEAYPFVIEQGFLKPFQTEDIESLKQTFLSSQQVMIDLQDFSINQHLWSISFTITPFSDASIWVQILAKEKLSLFYQHFLSFACGVVMLAKLIAQYIKDSNSIYLNVPEYLLSVFLVNNFLFCLSDQINFQVIIILDGIACLISWLIILKFLNKEDYHIGFLLKQSYILVGRLFVSFGPIFIAFCIFGYCCFCRVSGQFSTFKRTFLSLFYISYYNMTYQSIIVTSRANPISMIFFFAFVILFTICVYSGMLVSVFCSYVWNKRENKVKEDIINNLKIQCSSCDHKYKYVDCLGLAKSTKRPTMRLSNILQIDFSNSQQRRKYKKALHTKIKGLSQRLIIFIEQSSKIAQSKEYTKMQRSVWIKQLSNFLQKTNSIQQNKQPYQFQNPIVISQKKDQ